MGTAVFGFVVAGTRPLIVRLFYSLILALGLGYLSAKHMTVRIAEQEALTIGSWQTLAAVKTQNSLRGFISSRYLMAAEAAEGRLPISNEEEVLFVIRVNTEHGCASVTSLATLQVEEWMMTAEYESGGPPMILPHGDSYFSFSSSDVGFLRAVTLRVRNPSAQFLLELAEGTLELPSLELGVCP